MLLFVKFLTKVSTSITSGIIHALRFRCEVRGGGDSREKGVLSYSGPSIDAITIQNPRTVADFAIDNISYGNATAAPEPAAASLAMLGWAAIVSVWILRRGDLRLLVQSRFSSMKTSALS
jgi:hypothetical protein